MKYLYAIATMMILISLYAGYSLFSSPASYKNIAISINDRNISTDELNQTINRLPLHVKDCYVATDKNDLVQSLIDKELLIQEAKRLGIDQEEAFRQSIQNFYEQSLIKILLERKTTSLAAEVTDAEADNYIRLLDKNIHLTITEYADIATAENKENESNRAETVALFQNLSAEIRYLLLSLKAGESSQPMPTQDGFIVYRLDTVEPSLEKELPPPDKKKVQRVIREYKKEKTLNDWMQALREKADIRVFDKEENGEN